MQLGLTLSEAKVFCVLSQEGPSTAKTISKTSGVAREAAYQILPKLQEKGLIEVIMSAPKMFRAIPKQEAYEILFQHRQEEDGNLKAKIAKALEAEKNNHPQTCASQKDCETIIIPKGEAQHRRITNECRNSQLHVNFIMPWNSFLKWRRLLAKEESRECQKRNVRIRVITGKNGQKKTPTYNELIPSPAELTQVDIGFTQQEPLVNLALFDTRSIYVALIPGQRVLETPLLWSNAPVMVEMGASYFEKLWTASKQIRKQEEPKNTLQRQLQETKIA